LEAFFQRLGTKGSLFSFSFSELEKQKKENPQIMEKRTENDLYLQT
jgi:hypothetical protein